MTEKYLNRKAHHDYFLLDRWESGICLLGCEVKSIREGKINLADSFVRLVKGEAFLFNCHITPYSKIQGHLELDPMRARKLLLHKPEIEKLQVLTAQKGFSIVPTCLYFKRGRAKVEIAVAKGKKEFDKRESIKRRIHQRETNTSIKNFQQGR